MNMTVATIPTTARTTAAVACLVALLVGATGCGTDDGTAPDPTAELPKTPAAQPSVPTQPHAGADTVELIDRARANQAAYLRHLMTEHAEATRQAHDRSALPHRKAPGQHAPGFDEATLADR